MDQHVNKTDVLDPASLVVSLKAMAEPTRLRLLLLLRQRDWNVKDLTEILGQSQPRLSRHLKLLNEAGLIERFQEGSWVYFHLSDRTDGGKLALRLLELTDQTTAETARDLERARHIKQAREAAAQKYFQANAGEWQKLRALHVSEAELEKAMQKILGNGPCDLFVDLGTGTGRILELFQDTYHHAIGFDINQAMLSLARSNIDKAGIAKAQIRHGDLYNLALDNDVADVVTMHQVIHYLSDPSAVLSEAKRILKPGGKLLIVDFAPHEFEFLRNEHAHERLGISNQLMLKWLRDTKLTLQSKRDLEPPPSDDKKLTVTMWLARNDDRPKKSTANSNLHAQSQQGAT